MIDYFQLLLLAAIAGFSIFFGFPIALSLDQRKKGFLNAISIGILLFIVIDVFSTSFSTVTTSLVSSLSARTPALDGAILLLVLIGGVALGLVGFAFYENNYMRNTSRSEAKLEKSMAGKERTERNRYRLATMVALGIGAHNLSEGLAIGQSYASGALGLALLLIIGFSAHNATEGFGIIGPLAGSERKPSMGFLIKLGLIGGGPTLLGTILGSLWISQILYVLFLSFAGGALIFIILLMHSIAIKQTANTTVITGIFIGIIAGLLTDMIIVLAGM